MLPLLFEFVGTLVFFYVIANVGQPIAISAALLGVIFFGAAVSGAHYNPGVSFMMWLLNKISSTQLVQYVLVQGLAAATVVLLSQSQAS
jgi:glycerol uptake facilitator-like aquaporin